MGSKKTIPSIGYPLRHSTGQPSPATSLANCQLVAKVNQPRRAIATGILSTNEVVDISHVQRS